MIIMIMYTGSDVNGVDFIPISITNNDRELDRPILKYPCKEGNEACYSLMACIFLAPSTFKLFWHHRQSK